MQYIWKVLGIVFLGAAAGCGPGSREGMGEDPDAAPVIFADAAPHADAPPVPVGPVEVTITADNAYSFGYGTGSQIDVFFQGTRAQTAGQIFNCPIGEGPEVYNVPAEAAPAGAYLYIVTWDDLSVTQGVLGQFKRASATVYTGDAEFQVCATGIDMSDSQVGPTQAEINQQIAICNAGSGDASTTSKGWVNSAGPVTGGAIGALAIGEDNAAYEGTFPVTCQPDPVAGTGGIDAQAHWMWYSPEPGEDAFHSDGTNQFRAYLIFRLPADQIIID
jgi:hypothetical protein